MVKGTLNSYCSLRNLRKKMLFRHVYPNHFIVYATFIVFVSGFLAVKSLETVQTFKSAVCLCYCCYSED